VDAGVGPGQVNNRLDVLLVQFFLTEVAKKALSWKPPESPLAVDGKYSENLKAWIWSMQTYLKSKGAFPWAVDGIVSPQKNPHWILPSSQSTIASLNFNYRVGHGADKHNKLWTAPNMPADLGSALKDHAAQSGG
jgi:hypothetical protein